MVVRADLHNTTVKQLLAWKAAGFRELSCLCNTLWSGGCGPNLIAIT